MIYTGGKKQSASCTPDFLHLKIFVVPRLAPRPSRDAAVSCPSRSMLTLSLFSRRLFYFGDDADWFRASFSLALEKPLFAIWGPGTSLDSLPIAWLKDNFAQLPPTTQKICGTLKKGKKSHLVL